MDACEVVEKELLRVISKFNGVHDHANRILSDITKNFQDLQSTIAEGMHILLVFFSSNLQKKNDLRRFGENISITGSSCLNYSH